MKPEQEAEEILVQEGFIEPEELEPEMAELLRQYHERMMKLIDKLAEEYSPFLYADDEVK